VICGEADSFIPAYCDGELAGIDREQVERHIATCERCAAKSRLASRFKAAVRAHMPPPPVPLGLRLRIKEALGDQEIAPRRWSFAAAPRVLPAAVAVALVLAIVVKIRDNQSVVLEQAQLSYQSELPMDVTGSDCGSIASWFRGRVGFPVRPPHLGAKGMCQGGRLVNVGVRPAAYIIYRVGDGHRVTLLVFDSADAPIEAPQRRVVNGREIYLDTDRGISTAAYRDRGLGYVVTSDYDEDELTRLVTTNFRVPASAP